MEMDGGKLGRMMLQEDAEIRNSGKGKSIDKKIIHVCLENVR